MLHCNIVSDRLVETTASTVETYFDQATFKGFPIPPSLVVRLELPRGGFVQPGEEVGLGLCEGYGAVLVLGWTDDGFKVRHSPIEGWEDRADVDVEMLEDKPRFPSGDELQHSSQRDLEVSAPAIRGFFANLI